MPSTNGVLESKLWSAADQLWTNTGLRVSEFSAPVLGLIFLRYADYRFAVVEAELKKTGTSGRRQIGKADYQAQSVLYLPETARFSYLQKLPEGENIGQAVINAMKSIEAENEDLKDILPKKLFFPKNRFQP